MTTELIQSFGLAAPPDSPYFELAFRRLPRLQPRCLAERLAVALADSALGWNIAQSYAIAKVRLPPVQWPASVHRGYHYLIDSECVDENLSLAYELQQPDPDHWAKRDLIRALLMCEDASDQTIAALFSWPPEAITLFEQLWWNIRDRRGELLYMAQLLNGSASGNAHPGEAAPTELGIRLMRIAQATGKSNAVLLAAGLADQGQQSSQQIMFEQIEQRVLTDAVIGQQMGFVNKKDNPALALVEKYLLDVPEVEDSIFSDPLLAMSMDRNAQHIFKTHAQAQLAERLRAGQCYAREKAQGNPQAKAPADEYQI